MKATKFNITIASIANYCTIPNMEFNGSLGIEGTYPQSYDSTLLDLYGNSGWAYLGDAGIRAAIDRVNNDPNILPNVHVNLKRFTDCGAYYPEADLEYWGNSAGYVSAVTGMEIVYNHTDVIGVVGNEFSSTAPGVAQILGNNKIPYCSASMASPRYSNKDVYPYFWRLFPNSFARGMLLMLQKWNVRRVAIVYQLDQEIGYAEWAHMKTLFSKSNIQVITSIGMRIDFDSNSADMCKETLLRTDARSAIFTFCLYMRTLIQHPGAGE
ncbi:periplasmic binding protein-like I [Chytriomyces cf. hyalinus JEL632]|nr:periplasmic binding protein-like I [Chytriomyces cf. hyalinus JEL632]